MAKGRNMRETSFIHISSTCGRVRRLLLSFASLSLSLPFCVRCACVFSLFYSMRLANVSMFAIASHIITLMIVYMVDKFHQITQNSD